MNSSVYHIPLSQLVIVLIPLVIVVFIYARWSLGYKTLLYAASRMILQLLIIGFVLISIFENRSPWIVTAILLFMLLVASWISMRPVRHLKPNPYPKALISIALGGVSTLILVILGVIRLEPWYEPRYLIPIAGMIFANSMNSVSLAAERFHHEYQKSQNYIEARTVAFRAALLPNTNAFFAVGLVSLPGMMTGQILAGISPLIAVRYQMMVMCMLLGASGISSAIFLRLQRVK